MKKVAIKNQVTFKISIFKEIFNDIPRNSKRISQDVVRFVKKTDKIILNRR